MKGPDRLMLYRKRVAAAMAASGDIHAYLVEMVSSRLKATRNGVCEYADAAIEWPDNSKDRSICQQPIEGAKNLLIMGDSIASDAYVWLHEAYPQYNIIQGTGIGCNIQRFDKELPRPCIATNKIALDIALSPTVKLEAVVLTSLWGATSIEGIAQTNVGPLIDKLLSRGRKLIVIGPPVGFTIPPFELIEKCPSSSGDGLTLAELDVCVKERSNVFRETNMVVKQFAERRGLPYVDLHELACTDSDCSVLDIVGQLIYTDTWHRSLPGDRFLARRIREKRVLERILGSL